MKRLRPAVFLDRDGTVNKEMHYLRCVEDLELLPGVAQAILRLRQGDYPVVVITNQSAVARGLLSEEGLREIHCEMERQLGSGGARLDGIYYCPHHPEYGLPPYRCTCDCRKPGPGLLKRAALELGIDLTRSFMIGDSLSDLQAGWNAGCRTVLVLTGYGERTYREADAEAIERIDHVAADLLAAADWIARQRKTRER